MSAIDRLEELERGGLKTTDDLRYYLKRVRAQVYGKHSHKRAAREAKRRELIRDLELILAVCEGRK